MTTGVWNRIMISDLGFAATPIGLLVSLRYFLAPLGVWAGRLSDQQRVFGFRRLFWIWLGRALMVASVFILGFETASLARGQEATALVWLVLALALLLFSLGNALSGSTFLALVYDRAAEHQRGRAVGIVWTFLLLGFTVGGILFGVMLPSEETAAGLSFTPETLQNLFVVAGMILGSLWFFSLLGEEKRSRAALPAAKAPESQTSLREDLMLVWRSRPMRFFAFYLALSMIFAFSQDLILEPFAADVFNMPADVTTRFAAYWGSMSILATIAFLFLSRRYKWMTNTVLSHVGVWVLVGTFALFGLSAIAELRFLVTPGLVLLGIGLGIWNVGTLGLMMDMSPFGRAGTFLGFWTLLVTFARGFGVSGGGIVRDIVLQITDSPTLSYGVVFVVGVFGLGAALYALSQVNVNTLQAADTRQSAEAVFAGSMD
ncbi:MAG: BCD family MFS transporter [Anaerolineae bacterium]